VVASFYNQRLSVSHGAANMGQASLSYMDSTVVSECLSEHMAALKLLSYQLVTAGLRLIAEVLTLVANSSVVFREEG
jgi:hypothetical protein